MKITIFGTWYAGLVTGTCLAEVGHEVLCIDVDTRKIESLKKGNIPIYEPWLEELVSRNMKSGRLTFSTDAKAGILFWKAIFNAVGTPPDKQNANMADLSYVKQVAETFWKYINEYKIFINKSTVPVGSG
jgi:UDPglucose 6-dehydrogenase